MSADQKRTVLNHQAAKFAVCWNANTPNQQQQQVMIKTDPAWHNGVT